MEFKEQLAYDLDNTFFNNDEFADIHKIDNEEVSIILLDATLKENQKYTEEGIIQGDFAYSVKIEDIEEPEPGEFQNFDGYSCIVAGVTKLTNTYKVILQINRGSGYGG